MIGSEENYFNEGKVLIAAANPDMMEYYISKNDLVILGNRYESQLCAIEMEQPASSSARRGSVHDHQEAGTGKRMYGHHPHRMTPIQRHVSSTRVCRSAIS